MRVKSPVERRLRGVGTRVTRATFRVSLTFCNLFTSKAHPTVSMHGISSGVDTTPTHVKSHSSLSAAMPRCHLSMSLKFSIAGSAIDHVCKRTGALSDRALEASDQEMSVLLRLCGLIMRPRTAAAESLSLANCLLDSTKGLGQIDMAN
jgi:hypothetical protein